MYIGQCPQLTQNYKQPFFSAERHITEKDAPHIFAILCGRSPWTQYLQSNLNAHFQSLPSKPIRIVTRADLARRYRAIFRQSMGADVQGFVDRRNATIFLNEFPVGNMGGSLLGIALHEAVHLFSHPPGKSNQPRASSFFFLGAGLSEGLTQVITEDIQTGQTISPLSKKWQAHEDFVPVARQFLGTFPAAVVGDAYFHGKLAELRRAIEYRWTFDAFQEVARATTAKNKTRALQLIGNLEKAYLNRPKPAVLRWVFR